MKAGLIAREEMRLALLRGYNILDTAAEDDFEDVAKLASEICNAPVALISMVEDERQWFKARIGFEPTQTTLDKSICAHAIVSDDFLEIPDMQKDDRTVDNPLVTGDDKVRFYAGALLKGDDGLPLGTLCVLDTVPRELTDFQKRTLKVLAKQVMRQIELRRALTDADILRKEVDHRVKNSLQSLEALIRIQAREEKSPEAKAALETVQMRLASVSRLHEAMYLTDAGATVNVPEFLGRVVTFASEQMPKGVTVHTDIAPVTLDSRGAASLGMIVNETLMNAAKYAYANRDTGTFSITGVLVDGTYVLTCADDGVGASPDGVAKGTGLGLRLVTAAVHQLGGELRIKDGPGYAIEVTWPVA